jgi:hypothetical protein
MEIQMAKKYMEKSPTITRRTHTKITRSYHHTPVTMIVFKEITVNNRSWLDV